MATFRFSLASVLKLRQGARDQARASLAKLLAALNTIRQQQNANIDEQNNTLNSMKELTTGGSLNLNLLSQCQLQVSQLRSSHMELENRSVEMERAIQEARNVLIAADQRVKVLENLEDKHREAFHQEQSRNEMLEEQERVTLNLARGRQS